MPGELILVNPRKKRSKGARRGLTALQRAYGFGGGKRRATRARRNPIVTRTTTAARNPSKGRRRRFRRARVVARSARRRISASGVGGFLTGTLMPAAIGAAGSVAVDLLWDRLPIPDSLKTGPLAPATRIALAIALGYGAGMIGGRRFGEQVAGGAIVVTMADLLKGYVQTVIPAPVPAVTMPATTPAKGRQNTKAYMGAYMGEWGYDNPGATMDYYSAGQNAGVYN